MWATLWDCQLTFQPRWYQDEAIESLFSYFQSKQGLPGVHNPVVGLPTGTGKSLVLGGFIQRALYRYPTTRILALTHVKKLIVQNTTKLTEIWPSAPVGIYSAGLGQKDTAHPVVFGGIQSVNNNAAAFGHRDLVGIDECHLLSPKANTTYQQTLGVLRAINPRIKVFGLSATLFRLGQGKIIDEVVDPELGDQRIFTDVCYDMTDIEGWKRLIAEGFLCPPIPKRTNTALDVSKVGIVNGDFAQGALEKAVDDDKLNFAAVKEMCEEGQQRQCWLVFCAGISHSEHIAEMLNRFGVPSAAMHSKKSKLLDANGDDENARNYKAWERGELRCLTNVDMLTTGVDHPPIDLIGMLRPTVSAGLWVQMLGRGTRPSPETGKVNCLVLDFARNTQRLGPINDPRVPKAKGKGDGVMPVKICDFCGTYNHTKNRFCDNVACGKEFPFELDISQSASTEEIIRSALPKVDYFDVMTTIYNLHKKAGSPDSIRVSYMCGMRKFDEWVCLEHPGFASKRARDWWRQRHWMEPPATTAEALAMMHQLRQPKRIRVWVNKSPAEVMSYEY